MIIVLFPFFHHHFHFVLLMNVLIFRLFSLGVSSGLFMASSPFVLIFAIILCVTTGYSSSYPSPFKRFAKAKQWWAFTASFGKMSGNTTIAQSDIDNFIQTEVMPKIDGFKIVETEGVWKNQTEDSFDVFVLSDEFSKMLKKLQDIGLLYKMNFAQDSVLLFYQRAKVLFL